MDATVAPLAMNDRHSVLALLVGVACDTVPSRYGAAGRRLWAGGSPPGILLGREHGSHKDAHHASAIAGAYWGSHRRLRGSSRATAGDYSTNRGSETHHCPGCSGGLVAIRQRGAYCHGAATFGGSDDAGGHGRGPIGRGTHGSH
jgi:hypothetical protein